MFDLFRKEVLRTQRTHRLGAVNFATPVSFVWWALIAIALVAATLAFLIFGHYTRHAEVAGQLEPSSGMLVLSAKTTGTITRTLVHEGEEVKANQPLIEVSSDLVSASMGDTHAVVSAQLRNQAMQVRATLHNIKSQTDEQAGDLSRRIGLLQAQIKQIDGQLALQDTQAVTAVNFAKKIKPAVDKGVISIAQFNQYQTAALAEMAQVKALERDRLNVGGQLSDLQTQLAQLPLDAAAKANQLRGQLAQLDAQLAENEAERGTVLRAPRDGLVSTLLVKAGQNVESGQPMISVLPSGSKLEAQLLVPSNAIGFVAPGSRVVLRYQAYPYQKFGQQYGRVVQVSRSALTPGEVTSLVGRSVTDPLYRVLVALDHQSINAYGKSEALKPGMELNADILLDRRSLWQWVFEPLYGMREQLSMNTAHQKD